MNRTSPTIRPFDWLNDPRIESLRVRKIIGENPMETYTDQSLDQPR
jgi:hypothetical protein